MRVEATTVFVDLCSDDCSARYRAEQNEVAHGSRRFTGLGNRNEGSTVRQLPATHHGWRRRSYLAGQPRTSAAQDQSGHAAAQPTD